jgi:hypothetical protein
VDGPVVAVVGDVVERDVDRHQSFRRRARRAVTAPPGRGSRG